MVKNTGCSSREPRFDPHGNIQQSENPVTRGLMPFFGLSSTKHKCSTHICMQANTHMHKTKINKSVRMLNI